MIRIVVADDHAIVRAGIRAVLGNEEDITIVAEAADGREALEAVLQHKPDVLLVDLSMPGLNGVEAIARVRTQAPATRVLVLTMHGGLEYARPALRAGALGYLVKGTGLDALVRALRAVAAGERFVEPRVERELSAGGLPKDEGDTMAGLSPREREVLQLVAEGHTNKEIAARLGLSPKTVDTHRMSVMRKLGVHDAQALTRFAVRSGLIGGE